MTAYPRLVRHGLALLALAAASAACAEETVLSLTPAQKEQILDEASKRPRAIGEPAINGLGSQIHGEVGMFVGTGGSRGVFGSMVAPIGDNATVGFAFENSRYGGWR